MSLSAFLKVDMTNVDAIKKMCERRGWQFQQHGNRVSFRVTGGYAGTVHVDLTGQRAPWYDGDGRRRMHQEVVQGDVRCRDGNQDQQIADMLDIAYQEAATIVAAEAKGRKWREGKSDNGYSWIEVEEPASREEALEAMFE